MSDQLTLEQAAVSHSNKAIISHRESRRSFTESLNISFQAGAVWQKEQFQRLITLAQEAAVIAGTEGFDDLRDEIQSICEQLQD